jgi:hypothetical protein
MTVPPGRSPGDRMSYRWTCHVCEKDIGVPTSDGLPIMQGIFKNAKTHRVIRKAAGNSIVCVYCLARGKVTQIEAGDNY